jgi:hypothetical protein
VASRGVEWWPEVVRCGGGATELGRSRRKVMTGEAHLSARHGEGWRRREVFPREGGGNRAGHDRRSAEAQWGEGERPVGKKVVVTGLKDRMGRLAAGRIEPKVKEKFFFE